MPEPPASTDPFAAVLGGGRGSGRVDKEAAPEALSAVERARALAEWMASANKHDDLVAYLQALDQKAGQQGLRIRGGAWEPVEDDGGPSGLHFLLVYEEDELVGVIDERGPDVRLLRHDRPPT